MGVERNEPMNDLIAKAKQSLKDWDFEIEGDDLDYHFVADIIGGMVVDIHVHFDSVEFTPASRENHGEPWNTETIDATVEFGEAKIMSAIIKNGESIVGALTDFTTPSMRVIIGAVGCYARETVMDANGCDKAGVPYV